MPGPFDGNTDGFHYSNRDPEIEDVYCPDCDSIMDSDECEICGFRAPTIEDREPTDEDMDRIRLRGILL